jgi:hypothetical protein
MPDMGLDWAEGVFMHSLGKRRLPKVVSLRHGLV